MEVTGPAEAHRATQYRSTGEMENVDQVCFWGIATPVTRKRDPTMTLHGQAAE